MTAKALTGRELDAWLAEHLFGRRPYIYYGGASDAGDYTYSGDAMLLVLEAMRERGYAYEVAASSRPATSVHARFISDSIAAFTMADSLPRAVAEAAKAALEAEQ